MFRRSCDGFTLIEISIVLVIIGLIVGGILVGRDLIRAAEIRATATQLEQFNTAANTFRSKYGCLPGDCAAASQFGFDPASAGNGDGVIGLCSDASCRVAPNPANLNHEYTDFWYHLGEANLIGGEFAPYSTLSDYLEVQPGIHSPLAKLPPKRTAAVAPRAAWWVHTDFVLASIIGNWRRPAHHFLLCIECPRVFDASGLMGAATSGFAPADLFSLDVKVDDGAPASGSMRAWGEASTLANNPVTFGFAYTGPGGPADPSCLAYDGVNPARYNVAYNGNAWTGLCSATSKASF